MRKIIYIDMDNVLVDFSSGIARLDEETKSKYGDSLDEEAKWGQPLTG